jgi:hypothetical protein
MTAEPDQQFVELLAEFLRENRATLHGLAATDRSVEIRIAALDAASRVHQRVSSPSGGMFTTTADSDVIASAVSYERYLRTGE